MIEPFGNGGIFGLGTGDFGQRVLISEVGAVLVKNRQILATGYNGVPRGLVHCAERGCLRDQLGIPSGERHELCRGLHAEQNAIAWAARHGVSVAGAEMHVTLSPCWECAGLIINSGIHRVVFLEEYRNPEGIHRLREAGISCEIATVNSVHFTNLQKLYASLTTR